MLPHERSRDGSVATEQARLSGTRRTRNALEMCVRAINNAEVVS